MATAAAPETGAYARVEGTRFFVVMAVVMSLTIVAGFVLHLAMGRSSFAVPWPYHLHGMIFMGWIGLYLAQHVSISTGNRSLHAGLGKLAYLFVPAMVASGTLIMIVVARRTGGPFFFHVSEFLWSNIMVLWCFGALAWWALRRRRYSGWHRRLMLCAMAILTGPGLGRLLPLPLMIPNSWLITTLATMIWPVIGIYADWHRDRRVHPAYRWGLSAYAATFAVSMALGYSPLGIAVTEWVIAGTPGADRPMEPFLPDGFTM
ncbi:hypothetical protein [Erythrobacter sp. JK5]|uniref:hypothetical protein n=1 Tax=Erythrobacter sp. JK5 TaxID=2829500 RepID=UPI001BA79D87|nr:hypothetical protein [Erythrobacter sp. JK5]QUL36700.1 hypothetical protein KDC96_09700 [Erythrobacter sp. JK5]